MKILAISDDDALVARIHCLQVDVLVACGDLQDETILKAKAHYQPQRTFAVRGNHDTAAPFPDGITDLHLKTVEFDGWTFGGFGGSWRYKPRGHHLFEQEEVAEQLTGYPRVDIFVAHNSPAEIHERDLDTHQGFAAFNTYITRTKPKCFIHGHQHLEFVTLLGETTIIGIYGEKLITLH